MNYKKLAAYVFVVVIGAFTGNAVIVQYGVQLVANAASLEQSE